MMAEYLRYCTDQELKYIDDWQGGTVKEILDFLEFIKEIFSWYHEREIVVKKRVVHVRLATSGWSGNEEIINHLNNNLWFGSRFWESSHRGGLHIYKIPITKISEREFLAGRKKQMKIIESHKETK